MGNALGMGTYLKYVTRAPVSCWKLMILIQLLRNYFKCFLVIATKDFVHDATHASNGRMGLQFNGELFNCVHG